MMRFKDFLAEKAMNRGEYAKAAARQGDAKVGFEFEFVVPEHSSILAAGDENRDSIQLRQIDDLNELREYFSISQGEMRKMERDYRDWAHSYTEDWLDQNTDQDLVDSEGAKYAREQAMNDFESLYTKQISFSEYIDGQFSTMYKYIESYDLEPKFGWEADTGNDSARVYSEDSASDNDEVKKQTFSNIEISLSDHLGQNVTTAWREPSMHFDRGDWLVVPDSSIEPSTRGVGAEVVSPPLPLKEALKYLKAMFAWMNEHHMETNDSTGLHINISLRDMGNVDLLKLVLFMGDKHVLRQFDRLSNTYTKPQTDAIINNLAGSGKLPRAASEMIAIAKGALSSHKYSSVHIAKMAEGYLEFRVAGDADYHQKYELIHDTVLRFVTALEIAADPTAERNEYLKKVTKILGKVESAEENKDLDGRPLSDVLEMGNQEATATNLNTWMADAKAGKITSPSTKARANEWVQEHLLKGLFRAFMELGIKKASARQTAEFKLILKRLGMTPADVNGPADPWKDDVLKKLGIRK